MNIQDRDKAKFV